ncbi:hypothetical protein Tco_1331080, partial [Tanacetum coccineum]
MERRVAESGCGDRIDPVMRSVFGVGRKSPLEKFSGGGEWWPAVEKFIFEPVETTEIKDWIMTDMSTKWKTWKHEIKKSSYDSSLTVDEIVALQTDDRVDIDDDLAKVKGPEKGGNIRCVGKFPATKKRRVQDPQVPLLKAEMKGLRKDFMSLGDDACNVPDNGLAHNPKNPRSAGASHHPKNSTSTATSAHPKYSRSTATSPHPKNPTSGTRPKNPTSGPSRQCYSYY